MADEPEAGDIVELGGGGRFPLPGWRPSRGAGVLAVAALAAGLLAGLAAGYAAGDRHARGSAALPERSPSAVPSARYAPVPAATFSFAGSPALVQDRGECATQHGRELQLGVQITNQSGVPLTLQTARAVLLLGGLRQVGQRWAPCGALPSGFVPGGDVLQPGASTWLTVTFQVKVRCPAPAPVRFTVGYLTRGHAAAASLPGFADLGQVPYSGCPANPAGSWHAYVIAPSP